MKKAAFRKDTLIRVLGYVKRYRFYLIASLVLSLITVGATLYVPILTGSAVDVIIGPGQVDFSTLGPILTGICVLVGVTALAQWLTGLCNNRMTYSTVRDIRTDAFRHIQKLPLSYLDRTASGDLVSRVITDVDQFVHRISAQRRPLCGFARGQDFRCFLQHTGQLPFLFFSCHVVLLRMIWSATTYHKASHKSSETGKIKLTILVVGSIP